MCWTMNTAAPVSPGIPGTTSASARGPPVDAAIAIARDAPREPMEPRWRGAPRHLRGAEVGPVRVDRDRDLIDHAARG